MFYGSYSVVTKDVPNLLSYHKVKTSGLEIFDPFKKKGGGHSKTLQCLQQTF